MRSEYWSEEEEVVAVVVGGLRMSLQRRERE